ncbi:helix-turn-helix transcriptional regulator [Mycobacteroides salmoniphilum]|uniref:Virulence regulon transcriptional activator VirF n=1 Tax=Mycobacteroides salmoniphilum TaxID=404941 RepID=A0A4R8SDG9_9MYCO|nr:AraC family transcriptional regulator [Mycobacteroides salmoniphilum]TDZ93500.1 Virulence regulon transcriptional activator VirF [Mycobacteroides salmoniphilum]TEA09283.1 Virulence regulon transcriptional activator VirF [Mycobacteroides salmoniphilum]
MADTLELTFVTEQIWASSEWHLDHPHHLVVVYRGGYVQTKELLIHGGPSTRALPKAGDVLVIPADRRATAIARGREIALCLLTVPTAVLADRSVPPRIAYPDPFMHQLIERVSQLADRDDVAARLFTESLIESLRLHLGDHYASLPHRSTGRTLDNRTQALLVEYLEDSLDSEITLTQLAAIAEMPVPDFSKAFVSAFHATPYQFLLERRMHRAKSLLATTSTPITEIAIAVGFNTPSHFATTFKHRVGTTPSTYRKSH